MSPVVDRTHLAAKPAAGLRIAVAEDDLEMRALLGARLRRAGCEVYEAADGNDLLHLLHGDADLDLVVSDVRMPGRTGLEVLSRLRGTEHEVPFIIITAFGDGLVHNEARRLGALAVFDKPFDIDDLVTAIVNLARV